VNNGVLTQPTVARRQLLRPYPQFTGVIPLYAAGAKSRYNALQMTGRKRLSRGLMFEGSFTYGKASGIGMSHQDSYNLDASWALASYDIAHCFVISYRYELRSGTTGFKNFAVRHGVTAQFRVEVLNAFQPGPVLGAEHERHVDVVGVITGQANAPRQLQFGLKLLW
jgi:hypothetical protein